jgi:iduronate 2-sulfatase
MSLFEESARVPLLIVAPGIANANSVAKTPVSHVDLFPTLAELCSVPMPSNLQGQSLVPILKDTNAKGRGWAITQVTRPKPGRNQDGADAKPFFGYSLRTERWRYTEWDSGAEGKELYDHHSDPNELTNLASDPKHSETLATLSKQLQNAIKTTLPATGQIPEVKQEMWAPLLVKP